MFVLRWQAHKFTKLYYKYCNFSTVDRNKIGFWLEHSNEETRKRIDSPSALYAHTFFCACCVFLSFSPFSHFVHCTHLHEFATIVRVLTTAQANQAYNVCIDDARCSSQASQ